MSSYKIRLLKLVHNKINDPPSQKKKGARWNGLQTFRRKKKSEDIPPQKSPYNMFYE